MDQYRAIIRKLMIAVNVIDGAYELIGKQIGVKENTLALFYALDDGLPHSQKEICEEWLIPKTTLNTIVKECVSAEYIVLHSNPHRKEKDICLTSLGQEYARKALKQVYELEEASMDETLKEFSLDFVRALENFAMKLKEKARSFGE
jgi:DNA-binding MarR family transcriptional regulator